MDFLSYKSNTVENIYVYYGIASDLTSMKVNYVKKRRQRRSQPAVGLRAFSVGGGSGPAAAILQQWRACWLGGEGDYDERVFQSRTGGWAARQ
jgi:hypothetical protein